MERAKLLQSNYKLMKWIYTGFRLNAASSIVSLLYITRGLTESQIFLLGSIFATSALLLEVPSSFLADKVGRKHTLQISLVCKIIYTTLLFTSTNFYLFAIASIFFGASYAMYSGTDMALLYDTQKELKQTETSNKKFGQYFGPAYLVKAFGIIIAGIIVNQTQLWQFQTVVAVDILVSIITCITISFLTEPNRNTHLQVENILKSASKTLKDNSKLLKTALNQNLVFIAEIIPYVQLLSYFTSQKLQPFTTNLFYGLCLLSLFFLLNKTHLVLPKSNNAQTINRLNKISLLFISLTIPSTLLNQPLLTLFLYMLFLISSGIRKPFFSTILNSQINSHDRSTTLSIANLTRSIPQIPLLILVAWLLNFNPHAGFYVSFTLVLITNIFLQITPEKPST